MVRETRNSHSPGTCRLSSAAPAPSRRNCHLDSVSDSEAAAGRRLCRWQAGAVPSQPPRPRNARGHSEIGPLVGFRGIAGMDAAGLPHSGI
jgi:hypothetical protein